MIWHRSPDELERRWQQFQDIVKEMYEAVGVDSTKLMQRISSWYEGHEEKRRQSLISWEQLHMNVNDKSKYRRRKFRDRIRSRRKRHQVFQDSVNKELTRATWQKRVARV